MNLIISGKTKDFTPALEEKISAKISKCSKLIEQRGEREAHVTHHMERRLHRIEVIVNFYDHSLVGEGLNDDLEAALCEAVEKLETQIVKLRNKWRDTHRDAKAVRTNKESWEANGSAPGVSPATTGSQPKANGRPKIFRVDYSENRKPMTLEEALLEMQRESDGYVVYRDSSRDCLSVLVRRPDGNFDLIES